MLEGVNEFDAVFQKCEKISIRNPKATLLAITAFISKLLVIPSEMDIRDVQLTVKVLYRFANTTPERFTAHWNYQNATLIACPTIRMWLAANNVVGSKWSILDKQKLGPKPKEVPKTAAKVDLKTGILNIKNRGTQIPACWTSNALK